MKSAIDALRHDGGVILYPTETLYGLGGRACDVVAAVRIGQIKGRGLQPLIVLVNDIPAWLPREARPIAEAFWPGPLTLIVPASGHFPQEILGPDGGVAVRYSSHPVAQELVEAVGPITSTSANRTGEPPLLDVKNHGLDVDAVVDCGAIAPSEASTMYHLKKGILRRGSLAPSLERFLDGGLEAGEQMP